MAGSRGRASALIAATIVSLGLAGPVPSAMASPYHETIYPAFERTAQELESRIGFLLPQVIATAVREETPHA